MKLSDSFALSLADNKYTVVGRSSVVLFMKYGENLKKRCGQRQRRGKGGEEEERDDAYREGKRERGEERLSAFTSGQNNKLAPTTTAGRPRCWGASTS